MNYIAAKTKALSMSAKLLTVNDYEELCRAPSPEALATSLGERANQNLSAECERISSYIYVKPVRDFVQAMAEGLQAGFHAPNANADGSAINHWSYLLWQKLGMLDKPSRASLKRVLGTEMDLRNILWLYRLKQFYQVEGGSAVGYLLPAGERINREAMAELMECKDATGLVDVFGKGFYSGIFREAADFRLGEQKLAKAVRAQFRKENFGVNTVCICKYLYEKHLEIRNIRTITEGLKFGFAPEEILIRLC